MPQHRDIVHENGLIKIIPPKEWLKREKAILEKIKNGTEIIHPKKHVVEEVKAWLLF